MFLPQPTTSLQDKFSSAQRKLNTSLIFINNCPPKKYIYTILLLTFSLRILRSTHFHFGELTNGMNMRWADSLKTGSGDISNNMVPYAIPSGAHQPSKWKKRKENAASLQLPQVTCYAQNCIPHAKYSQTLGHIQDQPKNLFGILIISHHSYRLYHVITFVVSALLYINYLKYLWKAPWHGGLFC